MTWLTKAFNVTRLGKTMLLKISAAVVVLIIGLLSYVAAQPSKMSISRELLINAPANDIFPMINSSRKANEWMPWVDVDPNVVMNYSGPEEGVDSASSWDSSGQMGSGQAVVVESIANQAVKTQLTYTKPMTMSQLAEVSLTPSDGGTLVKWSVTGENSFIGKFFSVFMNMDKAVGGQFEQGLAKLKATMENPR